MTARINQTAALLGRLEGLVCNILVDTDYDQLTDGDLESLDYMTERGLLVVDYWGDVKRSDEHGNPLP